MTGYVFYLVQELSLGQVHGIPQMRNSKEADPQVAPSACFNVMGSTSVCWVSDPDPHQLQARHMESDVCMKAVPRFVDDF